MTRCCCLLFFGDPSSRYWPSDHLSNSWFMSLREVSVTGLVAILHFGGFPIQRVVRCRPAGVEGQVTWPEGRSHVDWTRHPAQGAAQACCFLGGSVLSPSLVPAHRCPFLSIN